MKCSSLLASALLLACVTPGWAQVPADKARGTFQVISGLDISVWASEPLFVNPTCMDIDHKGRVWVCEAVNYRHTERKKPPVRPEGDRIVILEDTKGTGKADKAIIFYQGKDLLAPLGIAVAKDPVGPGYKVFVCQSPDILVFEDKDGDGKADGPPRKLLIGFNGFDHDHGVHGILIGPDMKLYFSVGDRGVKGLVDRHGKKWTTNQTDCQAGSIWRCDLDGKNLEMIAHNFRNEYEPCVDSFGTVFASDNDDDGSQQTRICFVIPGGNYGYWPRGAGQTHWHQEQPGVVPKILRTGFGSPTGMCVYEGSLLPKKYRDQLLHVDAGPRHIRCYHLTSAGAGYAVDREDMVTSSDTWFRPSDICVAPDGSVFVADWYDPGVGGHGIGDTTRGRIYRIAPKGNKPSVPKVDLNTKAGFLAALGSPALSVRYMAMAKIGSMERKTAIAWLESAAINKKEPVLRARALWQLGRMGFLRLLGAAMLDPDPRFRMLAIRIYRDLYDFTPEQYEADWQKALLKDPSAAVSREALLALRDADPAKARPLIIDLAKLYDGKDRFYLEAIGIAVGHHDKKRRVVILDDFEKAFPGWNEQIANLVWELRPPSVLPGLPKRLADKMLPAEQGGLIVDILASTPDSSGGKSLLSALQADIAPDTRDRIVFNLKRFLAGKWRDLAASKELAETIDHLLKSPATRADALTLIGAAQKTDAVDKVARIARDDKEARANRMAALRALAMLPAPHAVKALASFIAPKGPLRNEAMQALVNLSLIRKQPSTEPALAALQKVMLDDKLDQPVRHRAMEGLTGTKLGAAWLLDANDQKKLPDVFKADAGRLLRNAPYRDLRERALKAFPPPGKLSPDKIPTIAALLQRQGKPGRGRKLMAASSTNDLQCLKCHAVHGVGGNVGPDLSVIGSKSGRDYLFESIIYPSKAIADQYRNWAVETKKGQGLTGLLVEDKPGYIVLRDANAKDTRIERKDIEGKPEASPISIMPDNLLASMTEEDLVDIVAYLETLKTPALTMDWWHIVGPFDNGTADAGMDRVFPPETRIDLKDTYKGKSGPVKWRTVKPDNHGYVDLQGFLRGDSQNAISYLTRELDSPADQEASILLGTDDCAKLWLNGKLVYTARKHRAAVPEEDTVKVKLQKGKNTLLLKINNGDGPHGFYLSLLAAKELTRREK